MTQARDLGDAANKANFLDNVSSDLQAQLTSLILPAGLILPFGNTTAPTGFLACEGQVLVRADYLTLFTAIGVTWNTGGETGAQFRLPNFRGEFLRGWDNGAGNDPDASSRTGGDAVGSSQSYQIQSHTHTQAATSGGQWTDNSGGHLVAVQGTASVTSAGGNETRPRNKAVLYCIKT